MGVYAVWAWVDGAVYDGVVNIGLRPTLAAPGPSAVTMELHIPGTALDLYGQAIEVFFLGKLREERKFPSAAALKAQIRRDIRQARNLLDSVAEVLAPFRPKPYRRTCHP